ncbi:MAG: AMP-binding protein, partial [Ilumatobacter sp.]
MGELAYEAGPVDVDLIDETIPQNLTHTIDAHAHREALVSRHQGIRWTYAQFGHRVTDLAKS